MPVPTITLHNGVEIPQLGFGVFQVPPDETYEVVMNALEVGYRHLDTAAAYRNESAVGKAIAASGIARDELFITTKLWNAEHGKETAVPALEGSLERLGLERLDLYLIHWPLPAKGKYVETYLALQDGPYADGRIRALGVSNFTPTHLRRLLAAATVRPAVNQIELHPHFTQDEARAFHAEHEIVTEAWSPIGGQGGSVLDSPVITRIARQYDRSPAQVVLRWHLQLGNVVIPKSSNRARMAENFDVFGFELTTGDLAEITALGHEGRVGMDPDTFEFDKRFDY
ncbi:MAG: putative oxidoreductase/MSMEI [Frankiales bacterium]|nr:putative oxidoreductase/MSMEI [Frankiales bacterium]